MTLLENCTEIQRRLFNARTWLEFNEVIRVAWKHMGACYSCNQERAKSKARIESELAGLEVELQYEYRDTVQTHVVTIR